MQKEQSAHKTLTKGVGFQEMSINVPGTKLKAVIFYPTLEQTTISKIGLSSFTYKLARMLISSSKTSQIMLTRSSIGKMVNSISSGLRKVLEVEKFDILHAVQPIAALACIPIAKEFNIPENN